ncbi:maleylacetoacetate isomerase [Paracoccus rhizosphaerae]|uniref:Maleylacetoacetate isomerase n=1 Tax=Paracoccus rhizosphaerae TaxID=1133347 RepID=A0ABV6CDI1_9RHOB|nr:maleylacetoacetate isomerase [Paracoccus rhizosphaerae]
MVAEEAGKPVLYDYWRSSASYRVRIALNLKGIPFDRVSVDLVAGAHRQAEHLAVNPQGLVPALQIDGMVLTQSLAIMEYLEETRAGHALLPSGPSARAHVRALSLAVACDIHPVSNLAVLARVDALAGAEARANWNRDNIANGLKAIEAMMVQADPEGRFCYGDAPTMADCTLIPQLYNATRWGVIFDHLPRITAVWCACTDVNGGAKPGHAAA